MPIGRGLQVAATDPAQHVSVKAESSGPPIVPAQRHHYDGSLTQQRVDAIFRALVVRRALEQRASQGEPESDEG